MLLTACCSSNWRKSKSKDQLLVYDKVSVLDVDTDFNTATLINNVYHLTK